MPVNARLRDVTSKAPAECRAGTSKVPQLADEECFGASCICNSTSDWVGCHVPQLHARQLHRKRLVVMQHVALVVELCLHQPSFGRPAPELGPAMDAARAAGWSGRQYGGLNNGTDLHSVGEVRDERRPHHPRPLPCLSGEDLGDGHLVTRSQPAGGNSCCSRAAAEQLLQRVLRVWFRDSGIGRSLLSHHALDVRMRGEVCMVQRLTSSSACSGLFKSEPLKTTPAEQPGSARRVQQAHPLTARI